MTNEQCWPTNLKRSSEYCLTEGIDALSHPVWGVAPPPWAPGRREEYLRVENVTDYQEKTWQLAEVDIFTDLSDVEMGTISAAAPMKTYATGQLLYSPHQSISKLFFLKKGRVRIFRVAADGRALTTAIVTPGTIFGEMVALGQRMYDNFAEALDEAVVCEMSRDDVQRLLLSDPRIAARITAVLGERLAEMERRLCDSVFKTAPQRIATTLLTLATGKQSKLFERAPHIALTHEQIAALAGTSRETTTKVLNEFADNGLIRLARGRITLVQPALLTDQAGG